MQQKDVAALQTIRNENTKVTERCSEMFKLWLNREPEGSWRNLIDALKRIDQNKLAFDIEGLLLVRLTSEETDAVKQTSSSTGDQLSLKLGNIMDLMRNDVKNKNGGYRRGLCMEGLWRGWLFTMIGMKKLQDMFG